MAFFLVGFLTICLRQKCFLNELMQRQLKLPATMSAQLAYRDSASERVEKSLRRRFGRKLACVQHASGVKGGGGGAGVREGKKEKKEVGKKRKGDWREKEGNACYKNPVLFTSADAGVRKF